MPPPLVEAVEFVRGSYAEPLTPASLAARVGWPTPKFTRLGKRLLAMTPGQLILQTHLQAAARLRDKERSVSEIAAACGFYDHSSFARHFKSATGLTPVVYRAAARG